MEMRQSLKTNCLINKILTAYTQAMLYIQLKTLIERAVQAGGITVNRNEIKETVGSLKISDEVICAIAGAAAKEIKGVYSLAPCPVDIKKGFSFKSLNKDKFVQVQVNDSVAILDIYLVLNFGAKIQEVSEAVQKNVKAAVQNMSSITVSKVNVHIVSVHMDETTLSEQQ